METLFMLLPFIALVSAIINKKKDDLIYLCFFLLLFVLATFRHLYVGTDTYNYYLQYHKIKGGYPISIEPLWYILNRIVIFFGGSFQMVLAFANALILIPVFWIAKKTSRNKYLTIFFYLSLYLFFYSLNITRQTVAMSIVFIGFHELINKKYLKYLGLVILASFFHVSAILCLPFVLISKLPTKLWIHLLLLIICMLIGLLFHEKLLGYALSLMYSDYEDFNLQFGNFLGNLLFLIMLNSFYLFCYWISKDKGNLFKLYFIYILFMNVFIRIPFGMRIVLYVSMIQLIFYPYLIYNNRMQNKWIVTLVLLIFSLCIFAMNFGNGEILPYKLFNHE